jgi:hypothetical protein
MVKLIFSLAGVLVIVPRCSDKNYKITTEDLKKRVRLKQSKLTLLLNGLTIVCFLTEQKQNKLSPAEGGHKEMSSISLLTNGALVYESNQIKSKSKSFISHNRYDTNFISRLS